MFLLTDGYVTAGVSSITGLQRIAESVYKTSKMPVYTLGYGADHNAKLLQGISMTTRTSYTYAESNEAIPEVVGGILVALREEVAKGVRLEWSAGECCEVGAKEKEYLVGSLIANKPQWVLFKSPQDLKMIVGGEGGGGVLALPTPSESESLDVLEQVFRVRAIQLFQNPTMVLLADLEAEMVASPVATRPLILRLCAEIAEQRDFLQRPPPLLERQHHLLRHTSRMTNFANQRGLDEFQSPTQRQVSQALVYGFSQATEPTPHTTENTDPV